MLTFSIIIPLYNKEKYILRALKSIEQQTHCNYELIIINDCSTDNSLKKIEEFKGRYTIVHHEKNLGLSAARNTGIKNATNDYICFLDADDEWEPTFLEEINKLIHHFPTSKIWATSYFEIWNKSKRKPINYPAFIDEYYLGELSFFANNLYQGIYNHGSVCVHKEVYNKIGMYNETINFSEDIDFNIRAHIHFSLAYSAKRLMKYYMQTENQITRTSLKNKKLPDYTNYEKYCVNTPYLKKYLDFECYVLGKNLKKQGDKRYKEYVSFITPSNLNWKQKILIKCPKFVLNSIDLLKKILLKLGIKPHTY